MKQFHKFPHKYVQSVHIFVTNVDRSIAFYTEKLGFQLLSRQEQKAELTTDGTLALITLEQPSDAAPKQSRRTGLYHFALLVPTRVDLAAVISHLIHEKTPVTGGSDHLVSEALYLNDPDGNGIEIYVDRDPATWKWNGDMVDMTTDPMDVDGILASLPSNHQWQGLPTNTIMGHIHLHVGNVEQAKAFYLDCLGFEIVATYGGRAYFLSTGKYHHHIAINDWNGIGIPPADTHTAGLHYYTIVLPDETARSEIIANLEKHTAPIILENEEVFTTDPAGNKIKLVIQS